MTVPELRVGKDEARTAKSLGGLLRRYDRSVRFNIRFRGRGDPSGRPPERWGWNGILIRIFLINMVVIGALGAVVFWTASARNRLVETRIEGLTMQARIVANMIALGSSLEEDDRLLDEDLARAVFADIMGPAAARGRLFSMQGYPIHDTRFLSPRNQITRERLPPAKGPRAWTWDDVWAYVPDWSRWSPFRQNLPLNPEGVEADAKAFPEVVAVMNGADSEVSRRANANGELIVSVAVPVRDLINTRAVLLLSTEAGDLDAEIGARIQTLMMILGGAFILVLGLSLLLSRNIGRPIRSLALAADQVRRGEADESAIPALKGSPDEIAALAASFRAMTAALTDRLDTIESFAADVAHEIKNPLTSMRSALETLSRNQDPERAAKLMNLLQNDIRRIDRLISDISEASRLDAELSREKPAAIDMAAFVRMIVSLYQDRDPPLPVRLETAIADNELLQVQGREGALAQVVRNILDNAISFSPKDGLVSISLNRAGSLIFLTVSDEGPGIPPESLEKVFQRFYTHRPASHGFGKNSGLGLSISKQIVDQHGGRITAANRTDRSGAVFTVMIPGA
jgi:two-component system sensor histidine kinase ChvG